MSLKLLEELSTRFGETLGFLSLLNVRFVFANNKRQLESCFFVFACSTARCHRWLLLQTLQKSGCTFSDDLFCALIVASS